MPIHVSLANSKLGKIPNISLVPGKDCGNCQPCIKECYAQTPYRLYPSVREAWNENSKIIRSNYLDFFFQLYVWFTAQKRRPTFFRVHVAGDFLGQKIVDEWFKLARTYHKTRFFAYTKMNFDYSRKPENFSIIFSQWPNTPLIGNTERSSWLSSDPRAPEDAFRCQKSCDKCKYCWTGDKDVVMELH